MTKKNAAPRGTMRTARDAAGAAAISRAIEATGGDVAAAAVILGIQRSWLYVLIGRDARLLDVLGRVRDQTRAPGGRRKKEVIGNPRG